DLIAFGAFDEIFGLAAEAIAIPFLAADVSSPFAHRTAPIDDHITILQPAFGRGLKDSRVRAALNVTHVFVIPVRYQHHDHSQPVQFFRSDERVLNPAPAQFFIQLLDALFTPQLEAGVGETPVRSNELLGPLEGAELLDFAARDEKGGLD